MKDQETCYIECECGSNDHLIKFTYAGADNYDIGHVYTAIQMDQYRPWYKRFVLAIGYIFGKESRFGHWDCSLLEYPTIIKLRNFLNEAVIEIEKDSRHTAYDPEKGKKFHEEYWMNQDPVVTGDMQ